MSHALPEYEEARLRRALRAAADHVDPSDDGLERIHARVGPPLPVPLAWFVAIRMRLHMRLQDLYDSASERSRRAVALAVGSVRAQGDHNRRSRQAGRSRVPGLTWMRPGVAMGVVVFIVAAGTYMAIEVPQAISTSSNSGPPHTGKGPTGPGGSSGNSGQGQAHSSRSVGNSSGAGVTSPASSSPSNCTSSNIPGITGPSSSTSTAPSDTSPPPTPSSPTPSSTSPSPTPSPSDSSASADPSSGAAASTAPSDTGNASKAQRATLVAYSSPCPSPSHKKKSGKRHKAANSPAITGASGPLELPAPAATDVRTGTVY